MRFWVMFDDGLRPSRGGGKAALERQILRSICRSAPGKPCLAMVSGSLADFPPVGRSRDCRPWSLASGLPGGSGMQQVHPWNRRSSGSFGSICAPLAEARQRSGMRSGHGWASGNSRRCPKKSWAPLARLVWTSPNSNAGVTVPGNGEQPSSVGSRRLFPPFIRGAPFLSSRREPGA